MADDSPDALLDLLQTHFDQPDETSSEFDSQLTENENPNEPASPCSPAPKRLKLDTSPAPCHFSKSPDFWDDVVKVVTSYMDDAWFSMDEATLDQLGEDWDGNASTVTRAIAGIVNKCQEFKIGITEDPKHRWFVCDNGNYSKNYTKMTVVYVAPKGKKLYHESTGNMEKTQISKFKDTLLGEGKCMNKAPGGEGASDAYPHFCYVASKQVG